MSSTARLLVFLKSLSYQLDNWAGFFRAYTVPNTYLLLLGVLHTTDSDFSAVSLPRIFSRISPLYYSCSSASSFASFIAWKQVTSAYGSPKEEVGIALKTRQKLSLRTDLLYYLPEIITALEVADA